MFHKMLASALALGMLLTLHTKVHAEGDSSWTEKIQVGLEARVRNESNFNYDLNSSFGDKDNFTLLRAKINVTATPSENFRALAQIQSSRIFGDSLLSASPFGPGNVPRGIGADDEDIALHQGYLDIIYEGFTLRTGRQEINFGDQRLVGSLGWANRSRSFDGVALMHDSAADKSMLFFHIVQRNPEGTAFTSNDPFFFGAHVTLKEVLNGLDLYALGFLDRDGQTINLPVGPAGAVQDGNLGFVTLGFRTKDMPKEGLGYELEAAYQGGENDDVGIIAFAAHGAVGFGFGGELAPGVLLEYNVASGDNPNTRRDTAFNNLFPTNHNKYGYIDFMGWSNMHNFRGGLSASPMAGLTVSADYHLFLAYEEQAPTGAGAALLPRLIGRTSRDFGQEVDVLAVYKHEKFFKALAGYSVFFPGDMHPAPGDDVAHFAYLQIELVVN